MLWNATDYDCFQGVLHQVSNFDLYPPYDPPLHSERDVDQDGSQDIFGPFIEKREFIKTFDLFQGRSHPIGESV